MSSPRELLRSDAVPPYARTSRRHGLPVSHQSQLSNNFCSVLTSRACSGVLFVASPTFRPLLDIESFPCRRSECSVDATAVVPPLSPPARRCFSPLSEAGGGGGGGGGDLSEYIETLSAAAWLVKSSNNHDLARLVRRGFLAGPGGQYFLRSKKERERERKIRESIFFINYQASF